MIICVCRNINSKAVTSAVENGASTPASVMAHHGCRFNCGKCKDMIESMIPASDDQDMSPHCARQMAAE